MQDDAVRGTTAKVITWTVISHEMPHAKAALSMHDIGIMLRAPSESSHSKGKPHLLAVSCSTSTAFRPWDWASCSVAVQAPSNSSAWYELLGPAWLSPPIAPGQRSSYGFSWPASRVPAAGVWRPGSCKKQHVTIGQFEPRPIHADLLLQDCMEEFCNEVARHFMINCMIP